MTDSNIEVAELQNAIVDHIGYGSDNMIFNYEETDGGVKLDVVTINPRHRQSFLFHSVRGYNRVDTLKQMMEYVLNYKERRSSYTLQWTLRGEDELHTSYFRAATIMEAIDKLHFGRDPNTITIFSVVLNPIA